MIQNLINKIKIKNYNIFLMIYYVIRFNKIKKNINLFNYYNYYNYYLLIYVFLKIIN